MLKDLWKKIKKPQSADTSADADQKAVSADADNTAAEKESFLASLFEMEKPDSAADGSEAQPDKDNPAADQEAFQQDDLAQPDLQQSAADAFYENSERMEHSDAAVNPTVNNVASPKNKRIIHILIVMGILFMSIIVYLTWFEMFGKNDIMADSFNQRLWEREDDTLRGSIYDRNGTQLAYSEFTTTDSGDTYQTRHYPYDNLYTHVIGYSSQNYGKSLLEVAYNKQLMNMDTPDIIANITSTITGESKAGNDLYLTIDNDLQQKASDLLGDNNGAVVAIDPATGEVLAMVSKPDFNANDDALDENWDELSSSDESPFYSRAFQSKYAPGSTFKTLTSAAAIDNGLADFEVDDEGSVVINGKTFVNSGEEVNGYLDLADALTVSSNVYFTQLGVKLGEDNLKKLAADVGFDTAIPFDLDVTDSTFAYTSMDKTDQAAVGMGQGNLLVTPLHMAMLAAGIANDGVIMEPYLVSSAKSAGGTDILTKEPTPWLTFTSADTANQVTDMMVNVVDNGTGTQAQIYGVDVAGKTGTAENETDKDHAWFIGFAPADDPQIAVAVVLEYNGSYGGVAAAPIARDLMAYWLEK